LNFVSSVESQVEVNVFPAHTSPIARAEALSSAVTKNYLIIDFVFAKNITKLVTSLLRISKCSKCSEFPNAGSTSEFV
jgi:hypothetical protein